MLRFLVGIMTMVLVISPAVASADSVFLPTVQNGAGDLFTVNDVLVWIEETGNVMPLDCHVIADTPRLLFDYCIVQGAQPQMLVWDWKQGKLVAQ